MALSSVRLRQALRTLTPVLGRRTAITQVRTPPAVETSGVARLLRQPTDLQFRTFRSSPAWFSSSRSFNNQNEEIGPDTILFEGCDYNHWLITMDFPKDPKPTAEQMVETYVQTLAKGLNISIEEAKKRMYACSTTTYKGFQAVMTEEESEKFRGLPGVVFILPDSYINPATKEYGGDKYDNGIITPRPSPVQFGRTGGRYGDRNRNTERPRYDRQGGPMPNQQGNYPYDNRGSTMLNQQGNPPYGNRGPAMPNQQGNAQYDDRGPAMPNQQGNPQYDNRGPPRGWNYGAPQNYPPQQNYGPPGQAPTRMDNRGYAPGGRDNYQGDRRDAVPPYQGNYNQGQQGNYYPPEQRALSPGAQRNYAPDQSDIRGDNRTHGQGMGSGPSGFGQYQGHGESQRFSQVDQRDSTQGEALNHPPMGNTNRGTY